MKSSRLAGKTLAVKRSSVALHEFLRDSDLAEEYSGGTALIIRLRPVDYHRFHFPDAGIASPSRKLGSQLHSVHPIALATGAPTFHNKRRLTAIDSRMFGRILMVEVGALAVGRMVQTFRPGPVARGQEKGFFRVGGSAIVLLLQPGRIRIDDDLVETSAAGIETFVKCGTRIGSAV